MVHRGLPTTSGGFLPPIRAEGPLMPHTLRVFAALCALAGSMALALLKPLSGHAAPVAKAPARKLAAARAAMSQRVVQYAKRFIGVRYVYGGSSPRSGFDC